MTIEAFLRSATKQLSDSGIITARLDCLVLLEDALNQSRASILAHPEQKISSAQIEALQKSITRRCAHEPLAYIRGHAPFFGRSFIVTPDVLVPRPETEILIEVFLQHIPTSKSLKVADIGTGSGCIGITIALERTNTNVDVYDISPKALAVAKRNAEQLDALVGTFKSDLLESLQGSYDVLVANLPYVPTNFPINTAATHEPKLALFAGVDGLRDYQTFWQQLASVRQEPTFVLTEAFPSQHHYLATLARQNGYALEFIQDFTQLFVRI